MDKPLYEEFRLMQQLTEQPEQEPEQENQRTEPKEAEQAQSHAIRLCTRLEQAGHLLTPETTLVPEPIAERLQRPRAHRWCPRMSSPGSPRIRLSPSKFDIWTQTSLCVGEEASRNC
jgi:hypothetical protein